MDNDSYAWSILNKHVNKLCIWGSCWKSLELGPGDGILPVLLASSLGSR